MNILLLYLLCFGFIFFMLAAGHFVGFKSSVLLPSNEDSTSKKTTASELAEKLIEKNNLLNINITCLNSIKTNYYSYNYNVIKFSPEVKDSPYLSALAISSHCTNQARLSQKFGFFYLLKNFFSLISKIFPIIFIPVVLICAIINSITNSSIPALLILIALIGTAISFLIQTIILIFELNSSKKIINDISSLELFTDDEIKKLKSMVFGICKITFFNFSRLTLKIFSLMSPDYIFKQSY